MTFWTLKRPASFADILAELERREPRPFEMGEVSSTDPRGQDDGGADEGLRASGVRPRNRLIQSLAGLAWRRTRSAGIAEASAEEAYAEEAAEKMPPAEPRPSEPGRPRSEQDVIAEELGLGRALGKADLERLRRDFAKRNHPDRCAPALRSTAARRMSIANMLIDARLKGKQGPE